MVTSALQQFLMKSKDDDPLRFVWKPDSCARVHICLYYVPFQYRLRPLYRGTL